MKLSINERISEIAARAAEESGLELVHAESVGTTKNLTIRVYIDKPGGVTHEDCSQVSRTVDHILDAEDFIPTAYLLEVSSPGLERGLYKKEDFQRFVGSMAKVKLNTPVEGQRNFRGSIRAVENDEITFEDKTSGTVRFPYGTISKANLEVDLEEELKRSEKRRAEAE